MSCKYLFFSIITDKHCFFYAQGYVGGISLNYLANSYFSRTADQTVTASIKFADVIFQNGLQASKANVLGSVNSLSLKEFLKTALLDGMEQFFEQTVYLDECFITGTVGREYNFFSAHI